MLLYNAALDATINRTEAQARVLAPAGWVPADERRPWIDPDPQPSSDRTWLDPEPQDDAE